MRTNADPASARELFPVALAAGVSNHRPGTVLTPLQSRILIGVRRELAADDRGGGHGPGFMERARQSLLRVAAALGFELTAFEQDLVLAQLESEQRPFSVLQTLVDHPEVSDIIVSGFNHVSVVRGRTTVRTDTSFSDQNAYETFVEKLLERCGSAYSVKQPVGEGMLGSFARVHAVHRCLCEGGPYLTIRLNRFPTITLERLVDTGFLPAAAAAYLRAVVAGGATVLIAGEVGTGKTTLGRALAGSIGGDESILVIEDTPEIRLAHPNVRYVRTREQNAEGVGRMAPAECIRAGMRMAMHRIIFGEIRDAEAAEAFIDVCSSGHPGLSTLHARSLSDAVARLELFLGRIQRGVSKQVLTEQIGAAVQVAVFVEHCRETGRRRVKNIRELGPFADGVLRTRDIFTYRARAGRGEWCVVNRQSAHREAMDAMPEPHKISTLPGVIHA